MFFTGEISFSILSIYCKNANENINSHFDKSIKEQSSNLLKINSKRVALSVANLFSLRATFLPIVFKTTDPIRLTGGNLDRRKSENKIVFSRNLYSATLTTARLIDLIQQSDCRP